MPKLLNLKNFLEHVDFTRRVTILMPLFSGTNKVKITHKTPKLQQLIHFRNYHTDVLG
jgi:hypothetical protein